jgi:D-3-phosphoglycerate dehydrogenase
VCSGKRSHAPSHAAAEHSWALIMSAMKNIPGQMQNLQNGKWQQGVGKGLFGRRLGLYGYGRIAKRVAEYAEAFGMQVEWWGSADGRARAQADGRRIAKDRAGFFTENDIVSLHVRLTPETRGIITAADLAQMKQDALLVNTSRSALLGSDVLLQALDAGRPGAAAIDVFDQEPISWRDDKLACHWRVIATPHIGFVTEEELEMQFSEVFDQVVAWHNGVPINMVNPAVWQPVSDDA